jgi:N-carbamoyl-L-amino-acid hydrolase
MKLTVDQDRLWQELETLSSISDAEAPAVTRVVFTETDRKARAYVKQLCAEAGLVIREDAVGNTFARWVGSEEHAATVATGSHIDAIPNAGKFDGTVGVMGGLEAIRALQRSGFRPRRSIELVPFISEEPTRFGMGCLGSRMMAGTLGPEAGEQLKDKDGATLNEVRAAAGFTGSLSDVRLAQGHYAAFVELHIEQGPILEREGLEIGAVTAIAAPSALRLWIEGEGGHAGAVLMAGRRDAFLAAAEIALAVEAAAKGTGSADTVGTTGLCEIFPGAVNSIPSRVRMEIDVRDIDGARRDSVLTQIRRTIDEVTARRGVKIRVETLNADPPAQCDPKIVALVERACEKYGATHRRMISRAYHDSLFLSLIAPIAMIFIPCRAGVSHRPDEYASPDAIAQGTLILAETLRELSA